MTIYKGIEVDASLADLIRHMQGVEDYREVLGKLQGAWDTLALLGQLTGSAAEMSGTREAFQRLTADLLNHLGRETRNKTVADLRAKAQNVIDILVRNLFERTADIGFLSADEDVRTFLVGGGSRPALEARFQEYVDKYSVYSDIVLFNEHGRVVARLGKSTAGASQHPLLTKALTTSAPYVEFFGEADFLEPGQHLVYAYRVVSAEGKALGVLALVFRLRDETEGVFAKLVGDDDGVVLACIDTRGRVIASSSPIQLPVGIVLEAGITRADGQLVRFAGREYLAAACRTHGYQGYEGPDWLGLGLIPVEFAFQRNESHILSDMENKVLEAVMQHPNLFSEELRNIPKQAERIQEDLNRSVWNGSVRQVDKGQSNNGFSKTLLWEISNTGRKTQAVFEQSIGNLHQTVVAALLQNSVFRAAFAIDVMDRNLYERANDCRWWALNATFRSSLAAGAVSPEAALRCGEILAYINGLYTVYDRLVLFDAQGIVVATSRSDSDHLVGERLNEEWVTRTLALTSSQGYVVSSFVPSPLYEGRHTYIYGAAIHHPDDARVVGGIGIVFDSTPQFAAMLGDAAPRDSTDQPVPGAFAVFAGRDGRIISCHGRSFPVGSMFPCADLLASLSKPGQKTSRIAEIDGEYFALGAALSAGYREYKTVDGHQDDVVAICGFPLGSAKEVQGRPNHGPAAKNRGRRMGNSGADPVEIATFYVGKHWLGVPANDVIEAIDVGGITPTVGGNPELVAGVKMVRGQPVSIVRLDRLIPGGMDSESHPRQIVLVRTRNKACMGLLVDHLGEIPEVSKDDIRPLGSLSSKPDVLTVGVVAGLSDERDPFGMLSVLATDRLCCKLGCNCQAPPS